MSSNADITLCDPYPPKLTAAENEKSSASTRPRWMKVEKAGWRRIIQNFTPSWFAVTMGTGIVSLLLHAIPYSTRWLPWLSRIAFVLNLLLFVVVLGASILRYILYPALWSLMINHPVQSLFLGTAPMGFATLVDMFAYECVPHWGDWAANLAWGLWWLDVLISVATCFALPFMIMSAHPTSLSSMTAVWLLPIVAPIVAAASGTIVASVLPNPQHALITIIVSYVLWGTAVPFAMMILVIYFHRLAMHKLPPREAIVSVFLPLGPLGQGSFAIMSLGNMAREIFPKTDTLPLVSEAGNFLYVLGFAVGIIMWGFALVWLFFALASISRSKFPFNIGWWGFTFPIGVFATSTLTLAEFLPSEFFKVLGTVLSACVILLWFVVGYSTARKVASGEMFHAPCLQNMEPSCSMSAGGEQRV